MFFDSDTSGTPAHDPTTHPKGPVVWARNKFLAGLAVVTPLIVTYWILQFVYNTLHDWSQGPIRAAVDSVNGIVGDRVVDPASAGFILFERFIGVLIPLVVLIALGALASNVIGRRVVEAIDRLLLRVPFIRFIYKSLKQVIESFKSFGGKQSFKRVVYIDYPVPGAWMLGFVTGQFQDRIKKKNMSVVFVPGALSPMTGLLLSVESERLTDAPMTMEEAMKMIFSGGLVVPDSVGGAPRPVVEPVATPSPGDLPPGLPVAETGEVVPLPIPSAAMTEVSAAQATASHSPLKRLFSSLRGSHESV